mgnify:CR=1 FL=1
MRTIMIGGKHMRGVETRIQEIRHRIFREVARMAYHTEWSVDKRIEELPYKIIPGEVGNFRNDVFWRGRSWASGSVLPWDSRTAGHRTRHRYPRGSRRRISRRHTTRRRSSM